MDNSAECFEIARQCERNAAEVKSEQARQILLETAAQWRRLGENLKSCGTIAPPSAFSSSSLGEADAREEESSENEDREAQGRARPPADRYGNQ
jgi:hypothetical protein